MRGKSLEEVKNIIGGFPEFQYIHTDIGIEADMDWAELLIVDHTDKIIYAE